MTTPSNNYRQQIISPYFDNGYILVSSLILIAVATIITATILSSASIHARSISAAKNRSTEYFKAEQTLGASASWLKANSTSLASSFSRANFYTTFDRTVPTVGSNDTGATGIPTKLKTQATTKSVFLTNSNSIGTSEYPLTVDTVTAQNYSAKTQFAATSFGDDLVRVTLVDAVAGDPTQDFGDPDTGNALPQTDFSPIYRVDAMKAMNSGAYLYGYLFGTLAYDYGIGFYGKNFVEFRQDCDSYLSNNGAYTAVNKRANCSVGSDSDSSIHLNSTIYGSLKTKGAIIQSSPYGGKVCADFAAGCAHAGTTCQGATCTVPGLPTYSAWAVYCPANQGDVVINANTTVLVPGNAANQKCWNKITVNPNKTLTLKTTNYSYYIDTFDIANSGVINFAPDPANGTINLYVRKFVGDKFNGGQVFNINNKPYQLRIHYLGTDDLVLDGNANMSAFMIAPYANVTVQGSFVYNGGIKALGLTMTGSGQVHYDESGDITTLSDVTFTMRNEVAKYN